MGPSYNNSFGNSQVPGGAGPISSGTGDIILTPTPSGRKGGKTWLIVVVVVLFVIAIVAGIAAMVAGGGNGGSNDNRTINSYTNEYLNLLATGEEVDTAVSAESLALETVMNGETDNIYVVPYFYDTLSEENTGYYTKLAGLLDKISEKIANEKYSDDERRELEFLVSDSKAMMGYYFAGAALVYANSDYRYYFENLTLDGLMAAYGYPFAETSDPVLEGVGVTINNLYGVKREFYELVAQTSCMYNNEIDYACLGELNSAEINEVQDSITNLEAVDVANIDNMLAMILADAGRMNEIINGVTNE